MDTIWIVNMLLVNKRVDEIPFDTHAFDQALWDTTLVIPRFAVSIESSRTLNFCGKETVACVDATLPEPRCSFRLPRL
jgi:hypothetical protein